MRVPIVLAVLATALASWQTHAVVNHWGSKEGRLISLPEGKRVAQAYKRAQRRKGAGQGGGQGTKYHEPIHSKEVFSHIKQLPQKKTIITSVHKIFNDEYLLMDEWINYHSLVGGGSLFLFLLLLTRCTHISCSH
jgi:hypothetical protein